jgi:hypothetical protein
MESFDAAGPQAMKSQIGESLKRWLTNSRKIRGSVRTGCRRPRLALYCYVAGSTRVDWGPLLGASLDAKAHRGLAGSACWPVWSKSEELNP